MKINDTMASAFAQFRDLCRVLWNEILIGLGVD